MDPYRYKRLCALLDEVLLERPATDQRLAVSFLHMIRNHPVFTERYRPLFFHGNPLSDLVLHYVERTKRFAVIGVHLIRVTLNRLNAQVRDIPAAECDVLLVSHIFSRAQLNDPDDMYFGRLSRDLGERGISTVVLRLDSTPGILNTNRARQRLEGNIILDRFLSLPDEMRIAWEMWRQSIALRRQRAGASEGTRRRLLMFASNEALSMWSLSNLRRAKLVERVLTSVRPRVIATTYEGLPWERIVFARARSRVKGITCIGYQQAPIFKSQYSITRGIGRPYDPDVIFTSSEYSRRQLLGTANYPATTLEVLGSKRYQGHASAPARSIGRLEKVGVLVVPEGTVDECVMMFSFAKRSAALLPRCTFRWRLHPGITFNRLRRSSPALFARLPENVVLSSASFVSDIVNSDFALYRGSSAIINCINGGLIPVYLDIGGSDDIDPLYGLTGKVLRLREPEELAGLVRSASSAEANLRADGDAEIRDFAAHFYDPLDPDRLIAYIQPANACE